VTGTRTLSLLTGIILPPLIWLFALGFCFALVPYACTGRQEYMLHLTHAVTLVIGIACGALAYANWKSSHADYDRFLAAAGMLSSGLFVLMLVGQTLASILMGACQ
jgi:hypothetical protein